MKNPFASTHSVFTWSGRRALVTSALTLTLATGIVAGPASAQDGTGAATPTPPSACEIVPARASFGETATPGATPSVATPVMTDGATPVSSPAASTATDSLTQDLEATANAVAGCLSDERYETLVQITGDLYRGQMLGLSEPLSAEDFSTLAITLPDVPYQILSVEKASFTDETSATAVVTYQLAHQVRVSTWDFSRQQVEGQDAWVLESESAMAPVIPVNTSTIEVTIRDNAYTLNEEKVNGPSVALKASNADTVDHELLVLRLEGGATTKTLLQSSGPSLPEGVTFIGQATVPAGSEGTLLLSGLQPGTYTIVDLLPNADAMPNLSGGMEIAFTVE